MRKKFEKKCEFLKGKYAELCEDDRLVYKDVMMFSKDYVMVKEDEDDPMVVCEADEEIQLSEDEKDILRLGPKYCVLNKLSEEQFQREVEECIVKYRWELRNNEMRDEEIKKFGEDAYNAIESLFDEDELEKQDEDMRLEEAKLRMPFDEGKPQFWEKKSH